MAEKRMGTLSFNCGGRVFFSLPLSSLSIAAVRLPSHSRVSIGSRRGSMGGLVTCDAFTSILSQYTGYSFGLPIDESNTPPVFACRYTSLIVWLLQFALILYVSSDFTIFKACVGQRQTQRWQFTHRELSACIFPVSASKECTRFAHCRSQTRQAMHRSELRTTSYSGCM